MPKLTPIPWQKFEKFLLHVGCRLERTEGAHRIYSRSDLKRPVVVTTSKKGEIPKTHIKTNLNTLKIKAADYLKIMQGL